MTRSRAPRPAARRNGVAIGRKPHTRRPAVPAARLVAARLERVRDASLAERRGGVHGAGHRVHPMGVLYLKVRLEILAWARPPQLQGTVLAETGEHLTVRAERARADTDAGAAGAPGLGDL